MKRKLLILAVIAVFGAAAAANFLLPPAENKTPSPAIPAENSGDTTVFAGEASPKENTEPAEEKENNAEKINHNSETAGENGSRNKEVKSARPERENNSSLSLPSRQGEAARQTEKVKEKNNQEETNNPAESPRVTYNTYTVQQGDTLWLIAQSSGIPMAELLAVNQISENTPLYPGMTLKIPQYNIPPKKTPGPGYGELLDWWTEAQYLWPIGQNARIIDFETGKSFNVRRSYGAFHADAEPLTAADSTVMKEIWGGWSWTPRPVIVEINGRRIAASCHAMPHSIQTITDNNFDGHFCVHFLNSTRHSDNKVQADHQQNVRTAAGM